MTTNDIRAKVQQLREWASDGQRCDLAEREASIHRLALIEIACGCSDPTAMAEAAMETLKIPFARDYVTGN